MYDEDKKDQLLENHEYDGIQELDNPLPMWWLSTFFATIIFGFIYFLHIHLTPDHQIEDEYKLAVAEQEKKMKAAPAANALDTETLTAAASSSEEIEKGKVKFQALCSSCHGDKGQGGIGPNLTDAYWLHGSGDLAGIAKVISTGVLEKGMPAWSQVLKLDEVSQVTAFIKSIQGTHPPGAKAPQGVEIK